MEVTRHRICATTSISRIWYDCLPRVAFQTPPIYHGHCKEDKVCVYLGLVHGLNFDSV